MKWARQNYILVLIFFSAFIIRLIFVAPSSGIPSSDASSYDELGLSISKGEGYVNNGGTPNSFRPPFYPFFLAAVYKLFGHSYFAVRVIQSAIGSFACVFIFLIGKGIYDAGLGLWSVLIFIAYPPFIKSAELLLTELVFTFILALIIFYLLKIQKDARGVDCVMLGLLSGIAMLTKSMMLFFPIFIIPVFMYMGKSGFLTVFKKYAIVLLSIILVISPWIARNYKIYHRLVPISTQGGITFYSSYCPPNGIFGRLATIDDPVIAEADKISSPTLQNDFLVRETLRFISNNPKKVLLLELKKILYFWAPFDWEIMGKKWFNFIYLAMLPFFAIGFFLALKSFKRFYPVLLPIIYFQISGLVFYGSPRFRLAVEPYIFILSLIGVRMALRYLSAKKRGLS